MEKFEASPALILALLEIYALPKSGRHHSTVGVLAILRREGLVDKDEITVRGKAYVKVLLRVGLPQAAWFDADGNFLELIDGSDRWPI